MTLFLSILFLGIAVFFSRDTREATLVLAIGIPLIFQMARSERERKKFKKWATEDRRKTEEFSEQIQD